MTWRIAVVIPKYGLVGGAEGYAAEVTERLAKNPSFEIHVLANRWSGTSEQITFHRIPIITFPKYLTTISFAHFASKRISAMKFDLIHAHDRIFSADVFTMHGIPHRIWIEEVRKKRWMSLFDRGTAWVEQQLIENGGCRKLLPVSGLTKENFLKEYKQIDPDRMDIVPPGINAEQFTPVSQEERLLKRAAFGIGPDEFTILFVSMNFDIKGLDVLLSALARVKARQADKKWRLLIVGKGNKNEYAQKAARLGIAEHLIFPGVIAKEELPQVYSMCDIFAMPSKFDTFGMTVLEAMAAGLPVVISGNVGARDIVKEGVNGFIIQGTDNEADIAQRIEWLMNDSRRDEMSKAALQTAAENSWENVAKKIGIIYANTLAGKGL